jgi:hypothetical protein
MLGTADEVWVDAQRIKKFLGFLPTEGAVKLDVMLGAIQEARSDGSINNFLPLESTWAISLTGFAPTIFVTSNHPPLSPEAVVVKVVDA